MSDATMTNEIVPLKKERVTKVEKVIVERRTLTIQSRTVGWAAIVLFAAGLALGQWEPPARPASATTAIQPALATTTSTTTATQALSAAPQSLGK